MRFLLRSISGMILVLLIATACGVTDAMQDRFDRSLDASRDRLAERSGEIMERVDGAREGDYEVVLSNAITLQQLQAAGIPVGSATLDCDAPLHIVVMSGVFDRENLFASGVSLAGGGKEALALRLIAHIYDPQTDMLLGTIGDPNGSGLNMIVSDPALPSGSASGELWFEPAGTSGLTPFGECQ
jgi:hypothetical protein